MHRFFIFNKQTKPKTEIIPEKELLHQLTKVLRIRKNEEFFCIYENLELKSVLDGNIIKVIESKEFSLDKEYKITLIQGLPANKKVPLILQKATELNVDQIILWQAKRSTSKLDDLEKKKDRFEKIIIEACEQTRRNDIPMLGYINNLNDYDFNNQNVITLYENEKNIHLKQLLRKDNKNITVVIGPEGGLEEMEIDLLISKGSKIATLGKNILRTETASIATLAMIQYELEK